MNNAEQPLCEAPKREADFPFREVYETYIRNFSRSSFSPKLILMRLPGRVVGIFRRLIKRLSPLCVRNAHP